MTMKRYEGTFLGMPVFSDPSIAPDSFAIEPMSEGTRRELDAVKATIERRRQEGLAMVQARFHLRPQIITERDVIELVEPLAVKRGAA